MTQTPSHPPTALITGATGQDGSYLAELLLDRGYRVVGLTRSPGAAFTRNIAHLAGRMELAFTPYDVLSLVQIFRAYHPTEVYNLTGQSFVGKSWGMAEETVRSAGLIPLHLLEAIIHTDRSIRFFQASSCEIYCPEDGEKLTEDSPQNPYNPYGCAKAMAHNAVKAYRRQYGIFAANGVLFPHESPRRFEAFVSKKIVQGAVRIRKGELDHLKLGNLQIRRDWGYAPDYVEAMHRMLQLPEPEDLNLCYGEVRSVEEMARSVFGVLGLDYREYVRSDTSFIRKNEPETVAGSNAKAQRVLGWKPKVGFEEMMRIMVEAELKDWEQSAGPRNRPPVSSELL